MTAPEPTIPDEAVQKTAVVLWTLHHDQDDRTWAQATEWDRASALSDARALSRAAAPAILAANQPEPAHEIDCPACGATIRARMADQPTPDTDLRETLRDTLTGWPVGSGYYSTTVGTDEAGEMAEAVEAFVAERGAAARAEGERAGLLAAAAKAEQAAITGGIFNLDMAATWLRDRAAALASVEDPHA